MKQVWGKIKKMWPYFWHEDFWYRALMICMMTLALISFVITFNNIRVSRKNSEDMEYLIRMVATYMGSATKDEYDKIAESIRHDLVFSEYGQEIENYIQYIPNTADSCHICKANFPAQAFLVCTNTGVLYELDLFEKDVSLEEDDYNYTIMNFGYDEISGTSINIKKSPYKKEGTVSFRRGRGIVSAQRMKTLFCDDCIREILDTVKNQLIEEFVIFDSDRKAFYPIDSGTEVWIGDYCLEIEYEDDYEITIKYIKE